MSQCTKACFLQKSGTKTPVFVRFSSFIGSKGSKDTAVDVRGFATKFYTQEGNYDNLALSFPVFVMTDAMKFADFVHSIKPNPKTDVPQAAANHERVWDYISNNPESTHFIMWLMSDRGRPRSWRMMEGYPINTFIFINKDGKSTFVRFVWKPVLGVHSLLLEEANVIGGVDPDFHRHDMMEAINCGAYPEYHLGVQMIAEEDEFKYDFDVLDDSKLWPEEEIPFEIVGKMTLNRLVDNFFAEEEQSSFDPSNLIPGIDFSNDPVLQGRTFAYRDTHYHRLGTSNIESIPINKPIVETNYNQRDGYSRYRIDIDEISYKKNSLADDTPRTSTAEEGGFTSYPQKVSGHVTRDIPSSSFTDYYSQARLFWNSMTPVEKKHIIELFNFHLGSVPCKSIRQKNVDNFAHVDKNMATIIAENIGVNPPTIDNIVMHKCSPALSQANMPSYAYTQKVGILIGNDFNGREVMNAINTMKKYGVFIDIISNKLGDVVGSCGTKICVDKSFLVTNSVLYDSLYIVGGTVHNQDEFNDNIISFVNTAYKHYKPIGVATTGKCYIQASRDGNLAGLVFATNNSNFDNEFICAIAKQRFWDRT